MTAASGSAPVVLAVVGTRPEAVKMAPVVCALRRRPELRCVLCLTGQHEQMVDEVLAAFDLVADHRLGVMRPAQELVELTARLLVALDGLAASVAPRWIVAQGDTTSVLAASLVAFYHGIRFGHVEAGLRTGDLRQPFPEELNRRLADLVADAHFAPTARARQVLLDEGVDPARIHLTGNPVVDALHAVAGRSDASPPPGTDVASGRLVVATMHRRESFGPHLAELCDAIARVAQLAPDLRVVVPVHPNPQVRRVVEARLGAARGVSLVPPIDYLSFIQLMRRAALILTDSGGLQEEAPSFGVPVVVMRDTTERPEALETGRVWLAGRTTDRIVALAEQALAVDRSTIPPNPFGDGRAGERIAAILAAETG